MEIRIQRLFIVIVMTLSSCIITVYYIKVLLVTKQRTFRSADMHTLLSF